MSESTEKRVEQALDKLAEKSTPEGVDKVDRQFAAKLERLEEDKDASEEMCERLRVLWAMLKADGNAVPWKSKALIMAALSYFVSPFDVVPDVLGKPGYYDDALVVRIVYGRLGDEVKPFEQAKP